MRLKKLFSIFSKKIKKKVLIKETFRVSIFGRVMMNKCCSARRDEPSALFKVQKKNFEHPPPPRGKTPCKPKRRTSYLGTIWLSTNLPILDIKVSIDRKHAKVYTLAVWVRPKQHTARGGRRKPPLGTPGLKSRRTRLNARIRPVFTTDSGRGHPCASFGGSLDFPVARVPPLRAAQNGRRKKKKITSHFPRRVGELAAYIINKKGAHLCVT